MILAPYSNVINFLAFLFLVGVSFQACATLWVLAENSVWDCVTAVECLPALHYSVDFIFLSFLDQGFHCGILKLLEGH